MNTDLGMGGEDGFSLIEVLCAFVILSISAGITLQAIQLAAKSIGTAAEKTQILSLVSKLQLTISTAEGNNPARRGEMDGFHWEAHSISSRNERGDQQVSRLRVVTADGKRHYDFLISRQDLPQ